MCIDVNFPQCQCRNCSYPWFVNSYVMPILHNSTSGIVGFYQIITMLGTPRSFIDHVYENPGLEMRIYNLLILFQGNPLVFTLRSISTFMKFAHTVTCNLHRSRRTKTKKCPNGQPMVCLPGWSYAVMGPVTINRQGQTNTHTHNSNDP